MYLFHRFKKTYKTVKISHSEKGSCIFFPSYLPSTSSQSSSSSLSSSSFCSSLSNFLELTSAAGGAEVTMSKSSSLSTSSFDGKYLLAFRSVLALALEELFAARFEDKRGLGLTFLSSFSSASLRSLPGRRNEKSYLKYMYNCKVQ